MAISILGRRPRRRGGVARGNPPSVREVCLLGRVPSARDWAEGALVEWGGRPYRVEATQGEGASRYVHLAAASEERPGLDP